ncbi:hypothetical protein WH95_00595 [Kiloniella litopenaei]|uniref:Uncharacterized protein n=1 Tax=Kiloniella litopenaei TaxID=1549748 RepID=A0A0M2RDV3_9PROT|nr:hypothetical protein [Kiloniella litopenaei]KKJ78634.1 hypothetical protein WH95_00595 [Kiloniella litopenaei]
MKRDMDLLRKIMLEIENGKYDFETRSNADSNLFGLDPTGLDVGASDKLEHHFFYWRSLSTLKGKAISVEDIV